MKTIRIFLLILIVIGIGALITQKLWVPKLVTYILSREQEPAVVLKNDTLTQQCYSYSQAATKDAPYAVSEFLALSVKGSTVSGTKKGTQSGPDMTNGYEGTISGTIASWMITSLFSYVIEGSANTEKELYRYTADNKGIEKLRYPLLEGKNMLVPDTTKPYTVMLYSTVSCSEAR